MKNRDFAMFLTIVLSIYVVVNTYIYLRAKQALSLKGWHLWAFRLILLFIMFVYPLARIYRDHLPYKLEYFSEALTSWWIAAMFYLFLFILIIDLVRLANIAFHFIPDLVTLNKVMAGRLTALIVSLSVAGVLAYGYFNALNLRAKYVRIGEDNPLSKLNMRAVMVSDIHLGVLVDSKRFSKIVEKINSYKPDMIFIVGDLFDQDILHIPEMQGQMKSLKSKHGVLGVTGNHEWYSGIGKYTEFMQATGAKALRNEFVTIDGKFNIVGLDDNTGKRWGEDIPTLGEVMKKVKNKLPNIFLYHKPIGFEGAKEAGIDLMLCGHIHGGQMYPIKHITDWVYSLKSRDFVLGGMRVFISNGVGTWGPPVRVGADPEIVVIEMGQTIHP